MKKLGVFTIIGFVADILTCSQTLSNCLVSFGFTEETAKLINGYMLLASIVLTGILLGSWLVMYCIKDELKRVGNHGIPCAIWPYIHYKLRNKNHTLLTLIHHGLYHECFSIKQTIKDLKAHRTNNVPLRISDIAPQIGELLQNFHNLLYNTFHIDLSISIFTITESDQHRPILSKVAFHRSKAEAAKTGQRSAGVPYLVGYNNDQAETNYSNRAREYHTAHGNAEYLKNSVFDHILSTHDHSWISNDIVLDGVNNLYFSSSPNTGRYYRSFAAFAILPPNCLANQHAAIKGIIAFDSPKTNIFSHDECSFVMGLMAHIVYDILDELKS